MLCANVPAQVVFSVVAYALIGELASLERTEKGSRLYSFWMSGFQMTSEVLFKLEGLVAHIYGASKWLGMFFEVLAATLKEKTYPDVCKGMYSLLHPPLRKRLGTFFALKGSTGRFRNSEEACRFFRLVRAPRNTNAGF